MLVNSILIKDLEIECIIGIHPEERTTPQTLVLDIRAFFDFSPVLQSRSIRDTVDYSVVSRLACEIAQGGQYKLLEALASDLARALFEKFPIVQVELELRKSRPEVPKARYVGIVYRENRRQPLATGAREVSVIPAADRRPYAERVALITGSTKGLGKGFAQHLAELGCAVAVHYHEGREAAETFTAELKRQGCKAIALGGDLANATAMRNLAQAAEKQLGRIDFLINNVGAYTTRDLGEISPEEFAAVIQTNICGTFFLSREVLGGMQQRGFGRIVNIGQAGCERIEAHTKETPYHISKTGVLILTKSFAALAGKSGVTCNMISPGIMENTSYFPKDFAERIPLGRLGNFSDFYAALDYLLSPAAGYVTGTNLEVTGGYGL